jgi:hypothetical protein
MFKGVALQRILESAGPSTSDDSGECDVVYALFLEPKERKGSREGMFSSWENALETAIELLQPSPGLLHCELLVPPIPKHEGARTSFATYIGRRSGWQTDKLDGFNYYLIENIGRWRAVPVFKNKAASRLRGECDNEIGVEYSIGRYLTALAPFRWTARLLSDTRRSPAHCATLTARLLCNSEVQTLARPSSSYGPSTLYRELVASARSKASSIGAAQWKGVPMEVEGDLEQLLRGVMSQETVAGIGDAGCNGVVRALTMRACNALLDGDAAMQRLTQQQLATALLRWAVLREDSE